MTLPFISKATREIRYWLLRTLPPCQQLLPLMSQTLERPLKWRERVVLRLHLWACLWCVRYLEQLRIMRDTIHAHAKQVSSDETNTSIALPPDARARLKDAIRRSSR